MTTSHARFGEHGFFYVQPFHLMSQFGFKPQAVPMPDLTLRGPFITLAQALKVAGFAHSGGQAKQLVRSGQVRVNGEVENRPGRKLKSGDRFQVAEEAEWTVTE